MKMVEMYTLKGMLIELAEMKEGSYYLSEEERLALHHFNQAADMGEDYRLFLLQMAQEVGIEPEQLVYLRRWTGPGATGIE